MPREDVKEFAIAPEIAPVMLLGLACFDDQPAERRIRRANQKPGDRSWQMGESQARDQREGEFGPMMPKIGARSIPQRQARRVDISLTTGFRAIRVAHQEMRDGKLGGSIYLLQYLIR
jgi:hypothetical protein